MLHLYDKANSRMRFLIPVLMAALLYSCAPSRVVQPLKKGERTINASFGGPVINELGATFPIPLTTVTYAQGISDRATLFGSAHPTSLLFGTLQGELGAVYGLVMPDTAKRLLPGISIAPVLNGYRGATVADPNFNQFGIETDTSGACPAGTINGAGFVDEIGNIVLMAVETTNGTGYVLNLIKK